MSFADVMELDLPRFEDFYEVEEKQRAKLRNHLKSISTRLRRLTDKIASGKKTGRSNGNSKAGATVAELEALCKELESKLKLLGKTSSLQNENDKKTFEECSRKIEALWKKYRRCASALLLAKG